MQCPHCQNDTFDHLTPTDLYNLYKVYIDEIILLCANCHQEITESLEIQEHIMMIEQELNKIKIQDKFLVPSYFTNS